MPTHLKGVEQERFIRKRVNDDANEDFMESPRGSKSPRFRGHGSYGVGSQARASSAVTGLRGPMSSIMSERALKLINTKSQNRFRDEMIYEDLDDDDLQAYMPIKWRPEIDQNMDNLKW